MSKKQPSEFRRAGFTIVEVMFVLAIAGLILLLVFQVIPDLQRSSRNNQRKQDVQAILAAISHYELNNSGNLPGPPPDSPFLQYTKLTYYDDTMVGYTPPNPPLASGINVHVYVSWIESPANITSSVNLDTVNIYNYQKCNLSAGPGDSTHAGAGYSDVVARYAIETGPSSVDAKCQQL